MAKVKVKIQVEVSKGYMRSLNPLLKKKGLTLQEAVDRGMNEETPLGYLNMAVSLAACQGAGLILQAKRRVR